MAIVVRIWPRPRRSLKLKMNDGVVKADTSPAAVATDPLPNIDRKTGVPVSLKVFDLAGSQSECVSYHPGHAVHWIQYFKSVDAPLVIPVTADVADDGLHACGHTNDRVQSRHTRHGRGARHRCTVASRPRCDRT